jgi:hypothetical protein
MRVNVARVIVGLFLRHAGLGLFLAFGPGLKLV